MIGIPISMAASLFLAVVLNQQLRARNLFRTVFYLPTICAGIALLLLWKFMFNEEFGLINKALALIGIQGPGWLTGYHWAKPALMIVSLWTHMGGSSMILYLAGLQCIPPELYEAASIDGAGAWKKFTNITLPLLSPTTFFIFITSVIRGFQGGFESAYIMTQGGPNGATTTIGYYIYNHAFQWFNMGYASTVAMVLFVVILTVTLINWRYGGRKVEYV
jgi:multiple sugar transport system permease protein